MKLDATGIKFIQSREGLRLEAYLDVAGVPTIGHGTTVYPNGQKVKIGDVCTQEQAAFYLSHDAEYFERLVSSHIVTDHITKNQFNALVSLVYNIGPKFTTSTIKQVVLSDKRNDRVSVENAFMMWKKVKRNGVLVDSVGLINRRKKEVELYFS